MPEFLTEFNHPGTFLNTTAQLFLTDPGSMLLRLTLQFFRKVMVPDAKEAKINITVKRFCTDDLFSGKFTIEDSASGTGVQ